MKKRNEELVRDAESFMEHGQFQRAVGRYEDLGMAEEVKIASLACAADFLINADGYAVAIEFFKKGGRKDISDLISKICNDSGFTPNLANEMRPPCNPGCPNYASLSSQIGLLIQNSEYLREHCTSPLIVDVANKAKTLMQYISDEDFIGKAVAMKKNR